MAKIDNSNWDITPSDGVSVSGNKISFPNNTGYTDVKYQCIYSDESGNVFTREATVKACPTINLTLSLFDSNWDVVWSSDDQTNIEIMRQKLDMENVSGYTLYLRLPPGIINTAAQKIFGNNEYSLIVTKIPILSLNEILDAEDKSIYFPDEPIGNDGIIPEIEYVNKAYNVAEELKPYRGFATELVLIEDTDSENYGYFEYADLDVPLNHNYFYKCGIDESDGSEGTHVTNIKNSPERYGYWYTNNDEYKHATIKFKLKKDESIVVSFPLFIDPTPIFYNIDFSKINSSFISNLSILSGDGGNCQSCEMRGNLSRVELNGYMFAFENLLNYSRGDDGQHIIKLRNYLNFSNCLRNDSYLKEELTNRIHLEVYRDYIQGAPIIINNNVDNVVYQWCGSNHNVKDLLNDFYNLDNQDSHIKKYENGYGGFYGSDSENRLLTEVEAINNADGIVKNGELVLIPVFVYYGINITPCEGGGGPCYFPADLGIKLPDNIDGANIIIENDKNIRKVCYERNGEESCESISEASAVAKDSCTSQCGEDNERNWFGNCQ